MVASEETSWGLADRQRQLQIVMKRSTTPRPLLTHCNDDTSWLLSLPIPPSDKLRNSKAYFHILIDAWLTPGNTQLARWFLQQYHVEAPAFSSISDVCKYIAGIENIATKGTVPDCGEPADEGVIDMIIISSDGTDHANIDTLKHADPSIPVFINKAALGTVAGWKHFETILQIPNFGENNQLDWRAMGDLRKYLPEWMGLWRLAWQEAFPGLHVGLMIVYDPPEKDGNAECIIHTTHGIKKERVQIIAKAEPKIDTIALLHTTKETLSWPFRANIGAKNGLQVYRELDAKYWFSTHDEVVTSTGLAVYLLSDGPVMSEKAVQQAADEEEGDKEKPNFAIVGNGETIVLE